MGVESVSDDDHPERGYNGRTTCITIRNEGYHNASVQKAMLVCRQVKAKFWEDWNLRS